MSQPVTSFKFTFKLLSKIISSSVSFGRTSTSICFVIFDSSVCTVILVFPWFIAVIIPVSSMSAIFLSSGENITFLLLASSGRTTGFVSNLSPT